MCSSRALLAVDRRSFFATAVALRCSPLLSAALNKAYGVVDCRALLSRSARLPTRQRLETSWTASLPSLCLLLATASDESVLETTESRDSSYSRRTQSIDATSILVPLSLRHVLSHDLLQTLGLHLILLLRLLLRLTRPSGPGRRERSWLKTVAQAAANCDALLPVG